MSEAETECFKNVVEFVSHRTHAVFVLGHAEDVVERVLDIFRLGPVADEVDPSITIAHRDESDLGLQGVVGRFLILIVGTITDIARFEAHAIKAQMKVGMVLWQVIVGPHALVPATVAEKFVRCHAANSRVPMKDDSEG
jgi:hypothetical protein